MKDNRKIISELGSVKMAVMEIDVRTGKNTEQLNQYSGILDRHSEQLNNLTTLVERIEQKLDTVLTNYGQRIKKVEEKIGV